MWQIWNKIFRWDYVAWNFSRINGISRIHVDGQGRPYFFLPKNDFIRNTFIIKSSEDSDITWLTCPPEKYLSNPRVRKTVPPDKIRKLEQDVENMMQKIKDIKNAEDGEMVAFRLYEMALARNAIIKELSGNDM